VIQVRVPPFLIFPAAGVVVAVATEVVTGAETAGVVLTGIEVLGVVVVG